MRKVFDNDMVAHLWANRSQDEARSPNGNLFFRGDTIFSYGLHFPIAQHVYNDAFEHAVLFTTANYSHTTQHHKSIVSSALCNREAHEYVCPIFHVALGKDALNSTHFEAYEKRIVETIQKAKRARTYRKYHLEEAQRLAAEANAFAEFFGLEQRVTLPDDLDGMMAQAVALEAARKERERVADEARQAAIREEARVELAEWRLTPHLYLSSTARDMFTPDDQAKLEAVLDGIVQRWRAGERLANYREEDAIAFYGTMLRLADDGETVETSRRASFPADHARKFWPLLKALKQSGREYVRNGRTIHLGAFTVDRVESNGTVHAGCHTVKYGECELLARCLGLEV